ADRDRAEHGEDQEVGGHGEIHRTRTATTYSEGAGIDGPPRAARAPDPEQRGTRRGDPLLRSGGHAQLTVIPFCSARRSASETASSQAVAGSLPLASTRESSA